MPGPSVRLPAAKAVATARRRQARRQGRSRQGRGYQGGACQAGSSQGRAGQAREGHRGAPGRGRAAGCRRRPAQDKTGALPKFRWPANGRVISPSVRPPRAAERRHQYRPTGGYAGEGGRGRRRRLCRQRAEGLRQSRADPPSTTAGSPPMPMTKELWSSAATGEARPDHRAAPARPATSRPAAPLRDSARAPRPLDPTERPLVRQRIGSKPVTQRVSR